MIAERKYAAQLPVGRTGDPTPCGEERLVQQARASRSPKLDCERDRRPCVITANANEVLAAGA
jgi:hypothetical protein